MTTNNARKSIHTTREEWLTAAIKLVQPHFKAADAPLPKKLRVTVSFPYGVRGGSNVIGQHFPVGMSKDESHEVIVHPALDDANKVLGVLIHELCHAAAPAGAGHGPEFARIGHALKLEGKPTVMGSGPDFNKLIAKPIIAEIGKYPHAALIARSKKQSTRLIKCECSGCGYIARVSSKWLNQTGAPLCPDTTCDQHGEEMDAWVAANKW